MLKLQQPKEIQKGIFNSLSKINAESLRFFLSKEGRSIGRYFICRCGHSIISHKDEKGKCLVPSCPLMCFCFIPKGVQIKVKSEFIKNPLSIEGFEDFLRLKMIPIPQRNTKIFWKLWENHLRIYK
jgi:hypothetical protein